MNNPDQCWLQITSGRGPDECAYFVGKLCQIIRKESQNSNLEVEIIEAIPAQQPDSYLSVLLSVKGEFCHKFANQWQGSIQWICQSPFRPQHKRKNWFIGIDVWSVPQETEELSEKKVKFESMRSSGPGGQNVNKLETAVRVIHSPTGITAVAQEERSQYLNKKLALAKLFALLEAQKNQALQKVDQERWQKHNELERGNPIRIYQGEKFKQVK